MFLPTKCIRATPGAYFNPLAAKVESFSLVGMMFDEMQARTTSDAIVHFFENLSAEEQRKKYYEDDDAFHRWFEVAVGNRNADLVSQLVKFIHETPAPEGWAQLYETIYAEKVKEGETPRKRHWGLTSYHYHCLLRVFTHQSDLASIQQLTQIIQQRTIDEYDKTSKPLDNTDESVETKTKPVEEVWRTLYRQTSTINANSIAWMMWSNWTLGSLQTVLRIFSDVTVVSEVTPAVRQLLVSPPDGYENEWLRETQSLQSPPLTMLLYICCQYSSPMSGLTVDRGRIAESKQRAEKSVPTSAVVYTNVPAELVVIIAATKKLLQIPLTACDYIHLLVAVLNNYRVFQRIQRNVLFNQRRSKELFSHEGHTSFDFLIEDTHSVFSADVRASDDDVPSVHHIVPVVLRSLRGAFHVLGEDTGAIRHVGFVQKRLATLNGWVRTVLDCVLDDDADPGAVFDVLLSWGEVHGRPSFCLNITNYLYQRMQMPSKSVDVNGLSPLAVMRKRLLGGSNLKLTPRFTSISTMADVIRQYPAENAARAMLPKLLYFSSLSQNSDSYEEDTRWYLRAQQMMFAKTPQELLKMLKEFVNTRYADERKISYGVLREGVRCALDACVRFTPANKKMGPDAVKERHRWWLFNDARDISLTLYGSTQNTNEKVREIFLRDASPAPTKSVEKMDEEFEWLKKLDPKVKRPSLSADQYERETASWASLPANFVPAHFVDPGISNPYPHVCLGTSLAIAEDDDPFNEVYKVIQTCHSPQPTWYLGDKGTITRLLRCLLHRLEFRKAVDLMRSAIRVMGYGQKIDKDIQKFFHEIGDPSGSIAFKLAAGIMDGDVAATKARHIGSSSQPE